MQKIIEGFDDSERLNACGFENNSNGYRIYPFRSVRGSVSEEKPARLIIFYKILNFPDSTEKYNQIFLNILNSSVHLHQRLKLKMLLKQTIFRSLIIFFLNSLMNNSDGNQNEKLKQVMALAQKEDNKDMEKILSTLLNSWACEAVE